MDNLLYLDYLEKVADDIQLRDIIHSHTRQLAHSLIKMIENIYGDHNNKQTKTLFTKKHPKICLQVEKNN